MFSVVCQNEPKDIDSYTILKLHTIELQKTTTLGALLAFAESLVALQRLHIIIFFLCELFHYLDCCREFGFSFGDLCSEVSPYLLNIG